MTAKFLGTGGEPPGLRRNLEDLFGGLNPLFGFEDAQKIKRADFDDPCTVTDDDALQQCGFLA